MKLRSLFVLGAVALLAGSALAQTRTLVFGSDVVIELGGIKTVNLSQVLTLPTNAQGASAERFGNITAQFDIDIRYVDLEFTNGIDTYRASTAVSAQSTQFAFSAAANGPVIAANSSLAGAGAIGSFAYKDANTRTVQLSLQKASAPFFLPTNGVAQNLFTNGDGTPIKLMVNTANVNSLPGARYDFVPASGNRVLTQPVGTTQRNNVELAVSGFVQVVPEPGSIFAVVSGLAGVAALRRRKA